MAKINNPYAHCTDRCDKQNRSKSGITDQAYFIDYNQLDDNLKVLQSPQPLLTERQQGTIELLSYEHTVNGSSEETRYVTITAQGMHEGPHKPIQSSFHKPPSDDKDSTPVTIMGSPMDTDERPPVGHASVFTQHTIPHKHSAMEVVKREHSHSGLAKSSELSRFPVNIKQIEEANKSLRTHCPEVKTVDSDRAKESSPEVESERSKKLSSRPIQEVDLETSLRQMSPLAKTVDSEKAKKLLRGSGKYRETEKPLRGPSPETETVDYAGAKESLREPSPQVKQVDSEGAKTFSRESGKDRGTIRLDKTIEKPLRGPSPEIETVHFAGAKKSLREPSLQVKTEAAKKLIRESGKDRDSEKGTEKPLRGPSPEIETADSARATKS